MEKSLPPFETMVFVCTHQRAPGERVACANPGREGQAILEGLRKMVVEKGADEKIRICKSGCLDQCETGPNAIVLHPTGQAEWLKDLAVKNIKEVYDVLVENE